jgi:hypothetical protein
MNSRFFFLCLLAALSQFHCQAADTNAIVSIGSTGKDDTRTYRPTGRNTVLLATGEWSPPVSDGHGNKLRGRLVVYDSDLFTNMSGDLGWKCAAVSLEIQDMAGSNKPPTQIYFDLDNGLRFDLREANGAPADNLRMGEGGSFTVHPAFWASVPTDGILRLHAVWGRATISFGAGAKVPKDGDLSLVFHSKQSWLIPEDDLNPYFLSVTISPPPINSSLTNPAVPPGSGSLNPPRADSAPLDTNVWQGTLKIPAVPLQHGKLLPGDGV